MQYNNWPSLGATKQTDINLCPETKYYENRRAYSNAEAVPILSWNEPASLPHHLILEQRDPSETGKQFFSINTQRGGGTPRNETICPLSAKELRTTFLPVPKSISTEELSPKFSDRKPALLKLENQNSQECDIVTPKSYYQEGKVAQIGSCRSLLHKNSPTEPPTEKSINADQNLEVGKHDSTSHLDDSSKHQKQSKHKRYLSSTLSSNNITSNGGNSFFFQQRPLNQQPSSLSKQVSVILNSKETPSHQRNDSVRVSTNKTTLNNVTNIPNFQEQIALARQRKEPIFMEINLMENAAEPIKIKYQSESGSKTTTASNALKKREEFAQLLGGFGTNSKEKDPKSASKSVITTNNNVPGPLVELAVNALYNGNSKGSKFSQPKLLKGGATPTHASIVSGGGQQQAAYPSGHSSGFKTRNNSICLNGNGSSYLDGGGMHKNGQHHISSTRKLPPTANAPIQSSNNNGASVILKAQTNRKLNPNSLLHAFDNFSKMNSSNLQGGTPTCHSNRASPLNIKVNKRLFIPSAHNFNSCMRREDSSKKARLVSPDAIRNNNEVSSERKAMERHRLDFYSQFVDLINKENMSENTTELVIDDIFPLKPNKLKNDASSLQIEIANENSARKPTSSSGTKGPRTNQVLLKRLLKNTETHKKNVHSVFSHRTPSVILDDHSLQGNKLSVLNEQQGTKSPRHIQTGAASTSHQKKSSIDLRVARPDSKLRNSKSVIFDETKSKLFANENSHLFREKRQKSVTSRLDFQRLPNNLLADNNNPKTAKGQRSPISRRNLSLGDHNQLGINLPLSSVPPITTGRTATNNEYIFNINQADLIVQEPTSTPSAPKRGSSFKRGASELFVPQPPPTPPQQKQQPTPKTQQVSSTNEGKEAPISTRQNINVEHRLSEVKRGQHRKNAKSVAQTNALEEMVKKLNLQLQVEPQKCYITPEVSFDNNNEKREVVLNKTSGPVNQEVLLVRETGETISGPSFPRNLSNIGQRDGKSEVLVKPLPSRRENKATLEEDCSLTLLKERLMRSIRLSFIGSKDAAPTTSMDHYQFVKMIGKGAFGKVHLGIQVLTGKQVAIKCIDKIFMKDEASRRKIFQEVLILKKCLHVNVIRLLEVFENRKNLFIVMEFASGGDLLNFVKKSGRVSENETRPIFRQIVEGLRFCHNNNILHRDIKLDNILLDHDKTVKICDFGVSRFVKRGQRIMEQCGTPAYIAPEIIKDKGYEGCSADLWSLGVLLYAMLTGTVPFRANNLDDLHKAIIKGKFTIPESVSLEAGDLLNGLLQMIPLKRLTPDEILRHPWLKMEPGTGFATPRNDKSSIQQSYLKSGSVGQFPNPNCNIGTPGFVLNEEIVKQIEGFGFPREFVLKSLQSNDLNHASACYFLLAQEIISK